ncbi:hypothetical protein ABZY14_36940 [Streptomyces sp. NPDC006617]|uniref:hypothetical protein n=1 Tax=Streptomyces sp. NPDC006617 TaxID=3155354 RepID=UPI0033A47DC8
MQQDLLEVADTPAVCHAVTQVSGWLPGNPVTLRFTFAPDARGKMTAPAFTPDHSRPDDGLPTRMSGPWRRG